MLCYPFKGTTYKRVIPKQEINTSERDKFWQKEEEEEKRRIEEENRKKIEERLRIEEELRKREVHMKLLVLCYSYMLFEEFCCVKNIYDGNISFYGLILKHYC